MHKKLSVQNRLENALCAFTLLEMGHMLALEKEKDLGCKPGKCFFDPITIRNMKDLAGCVAIQSVALPDGYHWRPHGMTELPIEQHFGMLRAQFTSAQMSTRDYIRASARCAEQYVRKLRNSGSSNSSDVRFPVEEDKRLTDQEFSEAGRRAFNSALELMAICSDYTKPQLKRAYAAFASNRPVLAELEDSWIS